MLRLVRGALTLALLLTLAVVGVRAVGRLLPMPPVLGYVTYDTGVKALVLYDVRAGVRQVSLSGAALRGVRWLPGGDGLLVMDGDAWRVMHLRDGLRAPTESERVGTTYLPLPDWSQYASLQRGALRLYDVQPGSDGGQPLAGGQRLGLRDAVWSPDGARLAVTLSAVEPSYELRQIGVIERETGRLRLVENTPAVYTQMHWSPDGTRLAYIDAPQGIATIDIASQTSTRWITASETVDALDWLPGEGIAFATRDGKLYALDAPGETPRLLTDALAANTRLSAAPGGGWLAITSGTLTRHSLYLWNIETGRLRTVAHDLPASDFLAWQPR